jgi:DnaD/phage-associated family protein
MERESFIFYKSFYDSIKELDPKDQVQIYNAIFSYQFEGEIIELKGVCKSIFTLIIPQLEANNKRYANGCKGGRPKNNQSETKTKPKNNLEITKVEPNENDNVNENENDNVNENENIYDYIENNFARTLSPIEVEMIDTWEDNDLTRYAIKQAVLNGAYNIKYIDKILFNFEKQGIKSVQQAQEKEKQFNKITKKIIEEKPEWMDKELKNETLTEEESQELDNELNDLLESIDKIGV